MEPLRKCSADAHTHSFVVLMPHRSLLPRRYFDLKKYWLEFSVNEVNYVAKLSAVHEWLERSAIRLIVVDKHIRLCTSFHVNRFCRLAADFAIFIAYYIGLSFRVFIFSGTACFGNFSSVSSVRRRRKVRNCWMNSNSHLFHYFILREITRSPPRDSATHSKRSHTTASRPYGHSSQSPFTIAIFQ